MDSYPYQVTSLTTYITILRTVLGVIRNYSSLPYTDTYILHSGTMGFRKSPYTARFTPKVGIFSKKILNYLGINLLENYSRIMLKSVKESLLATYNLSNEEWINLYCF